MVLLSILTALLFGLSFLSGMLGLGVAFVVVRMARWNLLVVFGAGLAAWAIDLALGGTG